jgi:tellurite resistance protein
VEDDTPSAPPRRKISGPALSLGLGHGLGLGLRLRLGLGLGLGLRLRLRLRLGLSAFQNGGDARARPVYASGMTDGPVSGPLPDIDAPMLDALVETLFLAAHADGEFSDAERVQFAESVSKLTERQVKRDEIEALVAKLSPPRDDERPARLASIKERLPSKGARRTAFTLAVKLVASDGIVRTSERELLLDMADALELDRDTAADLVRKYEK